MAYSQVEKIFELPVGGAGCGDINIIFDGLNLCLKYEYGSSSSPLFGCIIFNGTIAYRFRNERHEAGHFSESYDCVVRQKSSAWLEELLRVESPGDFFSAKKSYHYSVYLSSIGLLEVISQSLTIEAENNKKN